MKKLTLISSIITNLLLLSAMICGMWIQSGQPGDISFHIICGKLAVVFSIITFVLLLIPLFHKKKGESL